MIAAGADLAAGEGVDLTASSFFSTKTGAAGAAGAVSSTFLGAVSSTSLGGGVTSSDLIFLAYGSLKISYSL